MRVAPLSVPCTLPESCSLLNCAQKEIRLCWSKLLAEKFVAVTCLKVAIGADSSPKLLPGKPDSRQDQIGEIARRILRLLQQNYFQAPSAELLL